MSPRVASQRTDAGSRAERQVSYAMLTLCELAGRVAALGDAVALTELLQRLLFYIPGTGMVCLVMFIDYLRRQELNRSNACADRAYDLTIDKFSRVNGDDTQLDPANGVIPVARKAGTECRRYFRAFIRHLDGKRSVLARMTALERETAEARALQALVKRHFYLSLRECQRSDYVSRYVWRLAGGNLKLLMPRSIAGRARRRWLETNVPDADPTRPNEQARVQAVIDADIGRPTFVSLPEGRPAHLNAPPVHPAPIPGQEVLAVTVEGLTDAVANEKAENIQGQRPAIRALGPARLSEMIRQIFEDLADDCYSLGAVAKEYGLSKATLSRFAGIRWRMDPNQMVTLVPDLWRNTAQVIGRDPDFVEAAKRAGVWQSIEEEVNRSPSVLVQGVTP